MLFAANALKLVQYSRSLVRTVDIDGPYFA